MNGTQVSPADENWLREFTVTSSDSVLEQRNRTFSLRQEWRLLPGGLHALVTTSFTNNSSEQLKVSLNLLLDTAMGEENGLPFQTDSGEYSRGETYYTKNEMPDWIKTIKNIHTPALTLILDGKGISRPEYLVMANWRRLKEAGLSFRPVEGRNFDLLPFSRADSALLIGFQEKTVPAGGQISVSLVLGLNENLPSLDNKALVQTFTPSEETENRRLRTYAIRERLSEVERELEDVNRLLESDQQIDRDIVNERENAADNLERRRAEYENL